MTLSAPDNSNRFEVCEQSEKKIRKENTKDEDHLVSECNQAKVLWHKEVQKSFNDHQKHGHTAKMLGIFIDTDGVSRVGGRLQNAPLPSSTKHPVLLPRRHHFSNLVIAKSHESVKHNGLRETLTQVRSDYWIPKGRQDVKSFLSKCVNCKRITGTVS